MCADNTYVIYEYKYFPFREFAIAFHAQSEFLRISWRMHSGLILRFIVIRESAICTRYCTLLRAIVAVMKRN